MFQWHVGNFHLRQQPGADLCSPPKTAFSIFSLEGWGPHCGGFIAAGGCSPYSWYQRRQTSDLMANKYCYFCSVVAFDLHTINSTATTRPIDRRHVLFVVVSPLFRSQVPGGVKGGTLWKYVECFVSSTDNGYNNVKCNLLRTYLFLFEFPYWLFQV